MSVSRQLLWISLLWLTACASSPPAAFYTLTPIPAAMERPIDGHSPSLALELLSLPEFLDRPQLVARRGNQLWFDDYQRWGGSLRDDLIRVLGENLAYLLNTSRIIHDGRVAVDYRISVQVLAFEIRDDHQALLNVRWMLFDGTDQRVIAIRQQSFQAPTANTPADQVAALSHLLAEFSRVLADQLRDKHTSALINGSTQS